MTDDVSAVYVDGRGSAPRSVALRARDGLLFVTGEGIERSAPLGTVRLSPCGGGGVLRFSDGATCEVADRAGFERLRAAAPSLQWEGGPRALVVTLLVLAAILAAGYHYGIPIAAGVAAARVPDKVTTIVGEDALASLEADLVHPTALPPQRQQQIASAFQRLLPPAQRGRYHLVFRSSPDLGANALALPSGHIVVTDGLIALARDDREILGVLAHEAGHVEANHGMRLVIQSSALAVAVGWLAGDFSSILAIAPTVLLQAKYSRDFERKADAYAADVLRANGIAPSVLADILERMEASGRPGSPGIEPARGAGVLDYAASHPATGERLEYLRGR